MLNTELEVIKLHEIETIVKEVLLEHEEHILAFIKLQMERGVDGDGQPVTLFGKTEYAPYTIEQKRKFGFGLGAETNWITNYMTGEFYDSLYLEPAPNGGFTILSADWKADKIIRRSGEKILKLNDRSLTILLNDFILPEVNRRLESLYGK